MQLENARLREDLSLAEKYGVSPVPATAHSSPDALSVVRAAVINQQTQSVAAEQLLSAGGSQGLAESDVVLDEPGPRLDQGSEAGIEPELDVLIGRCVVGRIASVGRWASALEPITDHRYRGLAQIIRPSDQGGSFGAEGILVGQGTELLQLTDVPTTQSVRVGDEVYTSDRDRRFPIPLYYGRVVRVEEAGRNWEIAVRPAVRVSELKTVAVLKVGHPAGKDPWPSEKSRRVERRAADLVRQVGTDLMKLFFTVIFTLAALLLQPLVDQAFAGVAVRPNLLLAPVAICVWLYCPGVRAVIGCGLVGLILDCLAGPQLGARAAGFCLLAALGSLTVGRRVDSWPRRIIIWGADPVRRRNALANRHMFLDGHDISTERRGLRGGAIGPGDDDCSERTVAGGRNAFARAARRKLVSPTRARDRSFVERGLTAMENRVTNVFSTPSGFAPRFDSDGPDNRGDGGSARLIWLFVAFAIPLLAVAARLVHLQCLLADDYVAAFETMSESLEPIPSIDGRIYAGDGRVLAEDVERYHISVHYRWLEDPPNEHWLTRLALSGLSRAQRRNRVVVDARRQQVLARRDALWARLAEASGLSPKTLAEKRAAIQQRVERIAARLAERQAERENEVADEAPVSSAGGSLMQRAWNALAAALTTAPRAPRRTNRSSPSRSCSTITWSSRMFPLEVRSGIDRGASSPVSRCARRLVVSPRLPRQHIRTPTWSGARVPVTASELTRTEVNAAGPDGGESTGGADARDPLDYQPGDRIGRTGVEAAYDSHLRGLRGLRRITRNRYGEVIREETVRSPRPGGSIELTLNTVVQQKMERLLDAALHRQPDSDPQVAKGQIPTGGAVVALDVQSGAVFVMASAPRFDFGPSGVPDPKTWQQLNDDPLRPLFHRAIQSALPPGSVFKVLSAVALLQSRKIDPDERFECSGYLDQPDRFRCAIYSQQKIGHGPVDLSDALSRSCNVYFFQAADRIGPQPIVEWAERFAFGRSTGIDLPFEKAGHLPDPGRDGPRHLNRQVGRDALASGGHADAGRRPIEPHRHAPADRADDGGDRQRRRPGHSLRRAPIGAAPG